MDIAVAVLLLLTVSLVALGVVAAVRTVRAVKRGVERSSAQARRVVEDAALKARRYTLVGPAGNLAQLRLDLRTSIDSTHRALEAGSSEDASLSEAAALLARLNDHARVLDGELKLLEREPDKARIADRLPGLTERAERITHSADSLRWAAQDRARQFNDDDLAVLAQQIDIEAGALRHWAPTTLPGGDPKQDPKLDPKQDPKQDPKHDRKHISRS
ncbi:hypothetical protein QMK19_05720 [Streptomyces sp. H10-C2]|uniref:hypothetical protein n=1 Tax=unclassified Streptomyces TaxID=2593676 RepID=UPI0024BB0C42|nr:MULTISPECIES: hypothetical protein [unclassified Streptomyces]MDJ0340172.1 hypothetical protein [Streptomyces sp. PH10-H1]MDJ0369191.1 hypothetical protein [Streptomyces sp. H10-C2]